MPPTHHPPMGSQVKMWLQVNRPRGHHNRVCEFTERTCAQEPQGQTTVGTAPLLVPPLWHKGLASLGPECRL